MPLLGNADLVRIDLPAEGEWVEVKRALSHYDRILTQRAAVKGARIHQDSSVDLDAPEVIEAAEYAGLDIAIKKMHVSIADGKPPEDVDATPENIRALDDASVDCIKKNLNELYPPLRSDDERKNLSANGAGRSAARAGHRKSSAG